MEEYLVGRAVVFSGVMEVRGELFDLKKGQIVEEEDDIITHDVWQLWNFY
jgi:hypothetical protein